MSRNDKGGTRTRTYSDCELGDSLVEVLISGENFESVDARIERGGGIDLNSGVIS